MPFVRYSIQLFLLMSMLTACAVRAPATREALPSPAPTAAAAASPVAAPIATPTALAALLAEMNAGPRANRPTPQDEEGRGIYPFAGLPEARSEPIYPPFILGPRRQTDQMTRQLYLLLPAELRQNTAFLIPDRVAQHPQAYLEYIRSRQQVVIIGNFVGIGDATSDRTWFLARHGVELSMLEQTIRLVQLLDRPIVAVNFTMGDSSSPYALDVRDRLQQQRDAILARYGLAALATPISWGADEAMAVAFAARLPEQTICVHYASQTARHFYDGGRTTPEVVHAKLAELGLREVADGCDFHALALTNASDDDGTFPDAEAQRRLDTAALASLPAEVLANLGRLAVIDARMFNGALDDAGLPVRCDYLAYGSWGTLANKVGLTLATAKILRVANNPAAQRQLYLEAVAHDLFANGYWLGRDQFIPLLDEQQIAFDHFDGYQSPREVTTVFAALNQFVNSAMQRHFAGTPCMTGRAIRLTPQLWRTFESEVHLTPALPGEVDVAGIYRTDLPPEIFDPTYQTGLRRLTLGDLVNEAR